MTTMLVLLVKLLLLMSGLFWFYLVGRYVKELAEGDMEKDLVIGIPIVLLVWVGVWLTSAWLLSI